MPGIPADETGLPAQRLYGEFARTTGQLHLFAEHIRQGAFLDRHHDEALPDRQPLLRPDLKMIQRPVGPVAVFAASSFPLAFSVAGGDTTAALAAGCPVIVKGHAAHPGTGELVAKAIEFAMTGEDIPPGAFSHVHSGPLEINRSLVEHQTIRVLAFTGSLAAGRVLFDLCTARPEPIPVFGELGSFNQLFLLPKVLRARAEEIGRGWAQSMSFGVGQFCTKPGVVFLLGMDGADRFLLGVRYTFREVSPATTSTHGIAEAFRTGVERLSEIDGGESVFVGEGREASLAVFSTDAETWRANPLLADEVFGPVGLSVCLEGPEALLAI